MQSAIINIVICLIGSFITTDAASSFMDDYPSCQHYIQAPTGPLKSYEDIYFQLYKRGERLHRHFLDQNALSELRFYPRCGILGPPGEPYNPSEGVVEQSNRIWPWLLWFSLDSTCYGVYITPTWILTTASCIKTNLVIIRRPSYLKESQIVHNSNFRLPDYYDRVTSEFDIALINVKEYAYTHPICLPLIAVPGNNFEYDRCFFIALEPRSISSVLQIKIVFDRSPECILLMRNMSVSNLTTICIKPELESAVFPEFIYGYAGLPVNCFFAYAWHVAALTLPKQPKDNFRALFVTEVGFFDPWIRTMAKD